MIILQGKQIITTQQNTQPPAQTLLVDESAQEATKRQYKFLFSHLKELLKLYINFFYRFFISCLVPEIFSLEVMRCPTS